MIKTVNYNYHETHQLTTFLATKIKRQMKDNFLLLTTIFFKFPTNTAMNTTKQSGIFAQYIFYKKYEYSYVDIFHAKKVVMGSTTELTMLYPKTKVNNQSHQRRAKIESSSRQKQKKVDLNKQKKKKENSQDRSKSKE